jgi:hypothetical protein
MEKAQTYSPSTRPIRTLEDFRLRVSGMTHENQLTTAGKELAKGFEWPFSGDTYRQAWGYLFVRSRQLGLVYCKHFKRFDKPIPPRPAIGDWVKLTSIGAIGIVAGYSRFHVLVLIEEEQREVEVSSDYLLKIE